MSKQTTKKTVLPPRNNSNGTGIDTSRFPVGTTCVAAAVTLGVPVLECPRRPTHRFPFCWLDEQGKERWLVHSYSAIGSREDDHQVIIRIMLKCQANGRLMVLLHGHNAPCKLESGTPAYLIFHELFIDGGSMARSAQYKNFWEDRAYCYREQRVPGPEKLPDDQLEPLVALNRVFLLEPTEPYDTEDPRSIHYYAARYGREEFDPISGTTTTVRDKKRKPPRTKREPKPKPEPKAKREPKPTPAPRPKAEPKPKPAPRPKVTKPKPPLRDVLDDLLGL